MNVPNLVKMFLWRACNNILPTKANLKKQGIVHNSCCNFCQLKEETVLHILWECPWAKDIWEECGRSMQNSTLIGNTFVEIWE